MSSGYGSGEKRVSKAIQDALNSPLLNDSDIYDAKKILFNLYFSSTNQNKNGRDKRGKLFHGKIWEKC